MDYRIFLVLCFATMAYCILPSDGGKKKRPSDSQKKQQKSPDERAVVHKKNGMPIPETMMNELSPRQQLSAFENDEEFEFNQEVHDILYNAAPAEQGENSNS